MYIYHALINTLSAHMIHIKRIIVVGSLVANRIRSGTFIPYLEALKQAHVEVEDRKKPLQLIAESALHDPFWCEEPAVSRTFELPKCSYADAAGNKIQTCLSAVQKKATVLATRALKTKAQKKQIQILKHSTSIDWSRNWLKGPQKK